ncbi:MAG: hypothetical protein Q8Q09_17650 [Deltaproteobacteria bacterium]|nr:hypothetical protein [Deltaproteobacteria bacterium]
MTFERVRLAACLLSAVCAAQCRPPTSNADATPGQDAVASLDAQDDATVTSDVVSADSRYTFPDDAPPVGNPASFDPSVKGPFRAGYRLLSFTYMPIGSSTARTIPVHVWYPTLALTGPRAVYARIVNDPESLRDAPPAPPAHAGGYPVQVYSHGDRGFAGTSHFLMRYFASHGWVSVAPDHIGNTLTEPVVTPRPYALYHLRSQDITAALDGVAGLAATDPLGGGVLQTTSTVLTGHSFGVHTVWTSAGAIFDVNAIRPLCTPANNCTPEDLATFGMNLRENRIVSAIAMAGAINRTLFGSTGHSRVTIPILAMSGSADPVGADVQFASTTTVPMRWIDIRGACHQFFALGACDAIPDVEQERIVGTWALAFARLTVLNDNSTAVMNVLRAMPSQSDRVTLQSRP